METLFEGFACIYMSSLWPLACCHFLNHGNCIFDFQVVKNVLENTSSGGFCSNDGIVHMTLPGLPFGGVGKCVCLCVSMSKLSYSPIPTLVQCISPLSVFSPPSSLVPFQGASGCGSYHGRWSFETFSHRRGCMMRSWGLEKINGLRYPPYQERSLSWLRWATTAKTSWPSCSPL